MTMNDNFLVEDLVRNIKLEIEKDQDDPFRTPYYFTFIDRMREFREIVIVGAGNYGRGLYKILKQNDICTVKCFADNAYERYKNGIYGNKVLPLSDAVRENKGAHFVVTPQYYLMELIRQLIKLGVDVNKIECFVMGNMGIEV